jgi:hypothetical protein
MERALKQAAGIVRERDRMEAIVAPTRLAWGTAA